MLATSTVRWLATLSGCGWEGRKCMKLLRLASMAGRGASSNEARTNKITVMAVLIATPSTSQSFWWKALSHKGHGSSSKTSSLNPSGILPTQSKTQQLRKCKNPCDVSRLSVLEWSTTKSPLSNVCRLCSRAVIPVDADFSFQPLSASMPLSSTCPRRTKRCPMPTMVCTSHRCLSSPGFPVLRKETLYAFFKQGKSHNACHPQVETTQRPFCFDTSLMGKPVTRSQYIKPS
mmetsp:Transcript_26094/g.57129  ORF Transcript_26094/g.57129 Transcript_26094/m.57129 type:complete len:232 (-) Transcript_26094:775-1470(-)